MSPKGFSRSAPSRTPTTVRRKPISSSCRLPFAWAARTTSTKCRAPTRSTSILQTRPSRKAKQLVGKKVKVKGQCLRCDHRASSRANRHGEQRDRGRLTSLDQGRSVSLGIRCPRRVSNIESFASLSLLRAPSLVRHRGSRFSRSNRLAPWPSDLASPGAGWPSPVPCP